MPASASHSDPTWESPVAIDYDRLMSRKFADIEHRYDWRDSVLYALGLGVGTDPISPQELRFVYEDGLQALPTMAVVLGHPGFWISDPDSGITFRQVVHGEQSLEIHTPLPPAGVMIARSRVEEVVDKGEGRGMILRVRRDLIDKATDMLQSSQVMSMVCREDGGFGGPQARPAPVIEIPDRAPDKTILRLVLPQAALLYRLSADLNPLHVDPETARAAGFDRPILHGLGTYGVAGYALLTACADGQADALRSLSCRFSAPVFPGETIRTDMWDECGAVRFRCTSVERDKIVLDRGEARFV